MQNFNIICIILPTIKFNQLWGYLMVEDNKGYNKQKSLDNTGLKILLHMTSFLRTNF